MSENYIVLDLEWNQCPYGKKKEVHDLPFEIIEIGAVKLNDRMEVIDSFQELIQPVVYRHLHFRTREVIHLTEKDLSGKRLFPEVADDFFTWCGPDPLFCIWGSSDLMEFQRNLAYHEMASPFPFPLFYCDVQKIFAIEYEEKHVRRSLETAVDFLKIKKREQFHGAYADACYTADIMKYLHEQTIKDFLSIDYYRTPADRKEEILIHYKGYDKFISKPFETRSQIMADRKASALVCPSCGRVIRKKIRWFSNGSKNFLSAGLCPDHGYVKGKMRIRPRTDGNSYIVRTTRPITQDDFLRLREKEQKLAAKLKKHESEKRSH